MKILYGIQTTGSGHISRALCVAKALIAQGHEVDALLSGPPVGEHWDLSEFNQVNHHAGLTFVMDDGKVSTLKTIKSLKIGRFVKAVKNLDLSGYDLVLNDFEPISAWAAKRQKVTSISLSNQASFRYGIPKAKAKKTDRLVMKYFAPCAHEVGLGWHHFNHPILPPIVDPLLDTLKVSNKGFILGYLPYDLLEKTVEILQQVEQLKFRLYGPYPEREVMKNVELVPLSRSGFLTDLASCHGLITNAGFASVSEALYLGKKVLVNPIDGQFEQESNAKILDVLELGSSCEALDKSAILKWLHTEQINAQNYPNVAEQFATWIGEKKWSSQESLIELSKSLWVNQENLDYE